MNNKIIFITGGARSGKSSFAEYLVREISSKNSLKPAYIATAEITDEEFQKRVDLHKQKRKNLFITYEETLNIDEIIKETFSQHDLYLLECITTWLGNVFFKVSSEGREDFAFNKIDLLLGIFKKDFSDINNSYDYLLKQNLNKTPLFDNLQLHAGDKTLIIISNEIGSGIVPISIETRTFRDLHGFVNQKIAKYSDMVFNVVSGIPIRIR